MFESHLNSFLPCGYASNSMYKERHLFHSALFQFLGIKQINFIYLFLICAMLALRVFVVAHGLSLGACWPVDSQFPNQGSNLCPLLWQVILNHWTTRKVLKN